MRGSRKDIPRNGSIWIDYTPINQGWEYWERVFDKAFSDAFRKKILKALADFQCNKNEYYTENRMDLKELKREICRLTKGKPTKNVGVEGYVRALTFDFFHVNPQASLAEASEYVLQMLKDNPEDCMKSQPKPEVCFTLVFYEMLSKAGFDCRRGSNEEMRDMSGRQLAPSTAFLNFIGLLVWGIKVEEITKAEVEKIQKIIKRRKEY